MRTLIACLSLAAVVFVSGCPRWLTPRSDQQPYGGPPMRETPTAAQLVGYLNDNAARVQALECDSLSLDCKQDGQNAHLNADLIAQQPKSFYLRGDVLGKPRIQLGSNDQEFWYWISEANPPYVFHCSYEDFAAGRVRNMPFPFNPEWLMGALGMAQVNPNGNYQVVAKRDVVELHEETVTPQGQPARRITIFSKSLSRETRTPLVVGHVLTDREGKNVYCSAQVLTHHVDRASGGVVPKKVHVFWPMEKAELTLELNRPKVSRGIDPQRSASAFSRQSLNRYQGFDLARGPDAKSTSLQQVGGDGYNR